jgi:hypothetical protein
MLAEMMTSLKPDAGQTELIATSESEGMALSDPTAVRTLISPGAELTDINKPLRWISFLMALYYHGVPLSVKWFSVHKTTVLRWIMGMSLSLWPEVSMFLVERIKGSIVYIDEKWIKGQWYYWFVVFFSANRTAHCYKVTQKPQPMGVEVDRGSTRTNKENPSSDNHRRSFKLSVCGFGSQTDPLSVSPSTGSNPLVEGTL